MYLVWECNINDMDNIYEERKEEREISCKTGVVSLSVIYTVLSSYCCLPKVKSIFQPSCRALAVHNIER